MRNFRNIFLALIVFFISSCAPLLAPGVSYENYSYGDIKNIKGSLNVLHLKELGNLRRGSSAGEIFYIRDKNDIYGPIHIEWENESGRKFSKDFILDKSKLTYDKKTHYSEKNISFFFYNEYVELYITNDYTDNYIARKRDDERKKRLLEKQSRVQLKNQ